MDEYIIGTNKLSQNVTSQDSPLHPQNMSGFNALENL